MAQGGPGFAVVGQFNSFAGQCLAWVQDQLGLVRQFPTAAAAWFKYAYTNAADIPESQIKKNDLIFFGGAPSNGGFGHVGIINDDKKTYTSVLSNGNEVVAPLSNGFGAPLLGFVDSTKIGATKELTIVKDIGTTTAVKKPGFGDGLASGLTKPLGTGAFGETAATAAGIPTPKLPFPGNPLEWFRTQAARVVWFTVGAIFVIMGIILLAKDPAAATVKLASEVKGAATI